MDSQTEPTIADKLEWYSIHKLPHGYREAPPAKPYNRRMRRELSRVAKREEQLRRWTKG